MIIEFLYGFIIGWLLLGAWAAWEFHRWGELASIKAFDSDAEVEKLCSDMSKGHHRYGR